MGILMFIIFGLIAGLVARAVVPGPQKMGVPMTIMLGIVGSFVGGFLSSLFTHQRVVDFHTAGFIGSVIGAIVLLLIGGALGRRGGGVPRAG